MPQGQVAKFFPGFGGNEKVIADFGNVTTQFFGHEITDGEAAAQYFEGIQAEAVGLVLHMDIAQSENFCGVFQMRKRGRCVHGKTFMEGADLVGSFGAEET